MQTPPVFLVSTPTTASTTSTSTSTTALTASSSLSTSSFTPASPASRPSTQPPSGIWHAMCQIVKRSRLREGSHQGDSGRALTARSAHLPHQPALGDPKAETKATQDTKSATPKYPSTLAEVWPKHVFSNAPAKALCEALLAQRGQWDGKALVPLLSKLNADALAELGEFAVYLQARCTPATEQAHMQLVKALPRTLMYKNERYTPEERATAAAQGLRVGQLSRGITRGLILTGQTHGLPDFFHYARFGCQPQDFRGLGHVVVELNERLSDEQLAHSIQYLVDDHSMLPQDHLQQLHQLARDRRTSPQTLHRLARTMTAAAVRPSEGMEHFVWITRIEWLNVLAAPLDRKAAIPPERQFILGHGVGTACQTADPRPLVQDIKRILACKDRLPDETSWVTDTIQFAQSRSRMLRPPTAPSRAGALWGLDPLACLSRLPQDPDCADHFENWMALPPPIDHIDAVTWYRAVEAIPLPFAQRHRVQRLKLAVGENFSTVRAALLPAQQADSEEEMATALGRLTDLYRYFGEREGLDFALGKTRDLARIRQEEARVRERIATIEQAMSELQALAPATSACESAAQAFLRQGLAQVTQVTLGPSLKELQANLALALGQASSSSTTRSSNVRPDGKVETKAAE